MALFLEKHSKFLSDVYNSSKLDISPFTVIPSVVFLGSTFFALHYRIQEYQIYAGWVGILCRELVFHWAFFYISRLWFVFIKFAKYVMMALEGYVMLTSPEQELHINVALTHACVFMLVLSLSILPLLVMGLQHLSSPSFQNLLVWVDEDPWLRSEIGISGHYLQRPVEVMRNTKQMNTSYRSKRSTSVDNDMVTARLKVFRPCRSMMTLKDVKSHRNYE